MNIRYTALSHSIFCGRIKKTCIGAVNWKKGFHACYNEVTLEKLGSYICNMLGHDSYTIY